MVKSTARATTVDIMAIEIVEIGTKPKFKGECILCGTMFKAEVEDCEIEVVDVMCYGRIFATAKCPYCGTTVQMDIIKEESI